MNGSDSEATAHLKAIEADEAAIGQRLDQFLAQELAPDVTRSRAQTLIRAGQVTVNSIIITEPKRKLAAKDLVEIALPAPAPEIPAAENIPLEILYEDDAVLVINKPVGLVVHPGAGNFTGTLVNALVHHCGENLSTIGGPNRRGIVHRLDKDTSGVMVIAKTDEAHQVLAEAFADHGREGDLERAYIALTWDGFEQSAGTIDAPLGRASDRVKRAVVPEHQDDARHAITRYTVLETYPKRDKALATLVECRLETGRTHQIRVHLAHIGHPVVGDRDYGLGFRTKANRLEPSLREKVENFHRQALHATRLGFLHPETGELLEFTSEPPQDMQDLIAGFRALT